MRSVEIDLPYHTYIEKPLEFDPVPVAKKALRDVERATPNSVTLFEAIEVAVSILSQTQEQKGIDFSGPLTVNALHKLAKGNKATPTDPAREETF